MGRRGGGGGGRSSGGGGRSRSSGGRSRSSGRSGGSSFSSGRSGGSSFGGSSYYRSARTNTYVGMPVSRTYTRRYASNPDAYYGAPSSHSGFMKVIVVIAILIALAVGISMIANSGPSITNNKNRTKIVSGYNFMNDCVYDEIDWIHSTSTTRDGMKYFYDKTGVQPVIILHEYEPGMTDAQKEDNTVKLYNEMFGDREDIFLYVYYDSAPTSDVDGYDTWCTGMNAMSIMDEDALDIFWQWLDYYWYGSTYDSGEEDEMFAAIYKKTADSIMEKSTTGFDVMFIGIAAVIVITVGATIVILVKAKHKRKKEEAEETARILSADIETLSSSSDDDLVNKYN